MFKGKNKSKIIGIDARFYGPIGKGLGRYTQEIVDNIIRIDKDNEYVIFLGKENFEEFKTENQNVTKILANARWYTLKEQVLMPWLFWRYRLNLVHVPHFNVPALAFKKLIVTIHDLILIRFPTARATTLGPALYKIKNLGYKFIIWSAVKRAKRIIAVSKYTKDDIVKHFKIKPDKVEVIYEGVANLAKNRDTLFTAKLNDKKVLTGYNIDKPFLLYVGNAYPHKNLEGLIKVFKEVKKSKPDLQLVLVGKEDYFYNRVKEYANKLGLTKEVLFPGYVSDEKLEILFQKALAYVFPSFYEGFGLPPLEAMAKGCPVVSSDKSCLPEVLGEAALYFNPENENEMKSRILKIIEDKKLRQELIQKGFNQVKKYSWWDAADKTLEVYEEVLDTRF